MIHKRSFTPYALPRGSHAAPQRRRCSGQSALVPYSTPASARAVGRPSERVVGSGAWALAHPRRAACGAVVDAAMAMVAACQGDRVATCRQRTALLSRRATHHTRGNTHDSNRFARSDLPPSRSSSMLHACGGSRCARPRVLSEARARRGSPSDDESCAQTVHAAPNNLQADGLSYAARGCAAGRPLPTKSREAPQFGSWMVTHTHCACVLPASRRGAAAARPASAGVGSRAAALLWTKKAIVLWTNCPRPIYT